MSESSKTSAAPSIAQRESIARQRLTEMAAKDGGKQPSQKAIEIAARLMAKRDARKAQSS